MKKVSKHLVASLAILCFFGTYAFGQVQQGSPKAGKMSASEFKIYNSLGATLEDFDFDAKCKIQSYTLYYIPNREDPIELKGQGSYFPTNIQRAVQAADRGDQYMFTDVKARCPGDQAGRKIAGMTVMIK